jgi:hypothetical protein
MAKSSSLEYDFYDTWRRVAPDLELEGPDIVSLKDLIDIDVSRSEGKPPREVSHRFDFVCHEAKVIIELNGGTYSRQRTGHSTALGLNKDYYKMMVAQIGGWQLFYLDTKMGVDEELVKILADHVRGLTKQLWFRKVPNVYQCLSYQNNQKKQTQYTRCVLGLHRWLTEGSYSANNLGTIKAMLAQVLMHMPKSRSRVKPTTHTMAAVVKDYGLLQGKVQVKGKWETTYRLPPNFDLDLLLQ